MNDMLPRVITEQFDWRNKGYIYTDNMSIPQGEWDIQLDRNAIDGSFNAKMDDPFGFKRHVFTENNKGVEVGNCDRVGYYNLHSSMIDSKGLSETNSFAATADYQGLNSFVNFVLFPKKHPFNKNIILRNNEYLLLKSINSIDFKVKKTILIGTQYFTDIEPVITYTDTYIVPKEFNSLRPSDDLFDIYVKNEPGGEANTVGDIGFGEGEMKTSPTGTQKFKLTTIPSIDKVNTFDGAPMASKIEVFDLTKYNYEKQKVEIGYGKNSEKGVLVPYNFKGEYRRTFDISPNKPFEHLNLTLTNDIDEPLLDPYEGDVILSIKDIENKTDQPQAKIPWKTISSEQFDRLKDIDPSMVGIDRLANENNL